MKHESDSRDDASLKERKQRLYDFLNEHRVGVLATVDPNDEPHGVVVSTTVDEDFNVSFVTKTGTKKYNNLVRNNHVMLVVFDLASQTEVQVIGKAQMINDGYKINSIAATIFMNVTQVTKGEELPAATKLKAGEYTAFKIVPDQIRTASYANSESGVLENLFESIESFDLKSSKSEPKTDVDV